MKWRYPILISGGLCCSAWGFLYRPFPMPGENAAFDLVLYHTPLLHLDLLRRARRRSHCRRAVSSRSGGSDLTTPRLASSLVTTVTR